MNRFLLQAICCVALLFGSALAARAHAFLDHAEPAVGSTLAAAPPQLKIWFTDDLVATGCSLQVTDAAGKQVDKKDPRVDDKEKSLYTVSLPALPPGTYKVTWHALCPEGHKTQGTFTFTVKS